MTDVVRNLDFSDESLPPKLINVVLRIRPLTAEEEDRGEHTAVSWGEEEGMLQVQTKNRDYHKGTIRQSGFASFQFSTLFGPTASQREVFSGTTLPLVENLFRGEHGLVFAYGTTNAGKTYTIQGHGPTAPGLVHQSAKVIIDAANGNSSSIDINPDTLYEVSVSCVEIYNEQCFDLLEKRRARSRRVLRIKEDVTGSVHVEGLENLPVKKMSEIEEALTVSMSRRHVAETAHNERSSRSHTIFTIHLRQFKNYAGGVHELYRTSSLAIVDLAGSERSSRFAISDRERVRETAQINKSLMNLARCLEVLRDNQKRRDGKKHLVPYRQSRLTRLFQPSLERGSAVMIVNISPLLRDADETIHALSCAAVARQVHVGAQTAFYANKENLFMTPSAVKTMGSAFVHPLTNDRSCVVRLEEEVRRLQEALSLAETRACIMESEVREEAAHEMEIALATMEAEHAKRFEETMDKSEQLHEKRLELITKTARKRISRAAADACLDKVTSSKYQEWWEEERDLRQYEQEQYEEERENFVRRIASLEKVIREAGISIGSGDEATESDAGEAAMRRKGEKTGVESEDDDGSVTVR